MAERVLRVSILGDSRDLERAFKKSSRDAKEFDRNMGRTTRGVIAGSGAFASLGRSVAFASGSFLTGAGIIAGLKASVAAASNLNEQTTKSRQIFRGSSAEIEAWAQTTASAIGIANDQALAATGTFGNLFRTVGLGPDVASDMSRALTELAADLASFNNASPEDALDAIRSGLIGEAEPLRRYGVLLSEARVQQEAMDATGKRSAKSLTNQEKALARYRIILRDTAPAQGDFARTSEGLANQQRILAAELRDLSSDLGRIAIPALSAFIGELRDGIGIAQDFGNALGKIPFDKIPHRGDTDDFFHGFKDGIKNSIAPGLPILENAIGRVRSLKAEAEKPIKFNVDFSAVDALTAGLNRLETAGLQAKDAIEGHRAEIAAIGSRGPNITTEQRNQFFDARIARRVNRVQDANLRAQVAELRKIAASIEARIAVTKDITRKLNLEDDLLDVNRQRRGVEAQIADNAEAARQLDLDKKREAIEKARADAAEARQRNTERLARANARRAARQFAALGFGPTGGDLVPTRARLRKEIGTLSETVKGTFLDTAKTKSLFATMRRIISEALVPPEVRSKMRDMLADLRAQLKDHQGQLTKTTGLDSKSLLAGLGLDPDEIRALRARLAGFNSAGRALAGAGAPAGGGFVGGRPIVVESHTTVQMDGQTVAKTVTRNQQKKRRRNPAQRRGPNAGMAL